MALLPIIRKGDRTTHGGTVLEGFPNDTIHGIEIAGLGHLVTCPMCKGVFPIMECLPDRCGARYAYSLWSSTARVTGYGSR